MFRKNKKQRVIWLPVYNQYMDEIINNTTTEECDLLFGSIQTKKEVDNE